VTNRGSFKEIEYYYDLISRIKGEVIWILVATLCDDEMKVIKFEEGISLGARLNSIAYVEVSAKQGTNVNSVFKILAQEILKDKEQIHFEYIQRKIENYSLWSKALPWNWSRWNKWDIDLKKMKNIDEKKKEEIEINEEDFFTEFPSITTSPSDLFHDISLFFNNQSTCWDVVFEIENKPIYCHKIFLAVRSSYFRTKFYNSMKEKLGT